MPTMAGGVQATTQQQQRRNVAHMQQPQWLVRASSARMPLVSRFLRREQRIRRGARARKGLASHWTTIDDNGAADVRREYSLHAHAKGEQNVSRTVEASTATAFDKFPDPFARLVAGKKFHCTQCGKCCTGSGEVWISDEEAQHIAAHLGLNLKAFHRRYVKSNNSVPGWWMLKNKPWVEECIFLGANNQCTIHQFRPRQCSTYPWWPELMRPHEWEQEKKEVCEGFDHLEAGETDTADAAKQLKLATIQTMKLAAAKACVPQNILDAVADINNDSKL